MTEFVAGTPLVRVLSRQLGRVWLPGGISGLTLPELARRVSLALDTLQSLPCDAAIGSATRREEILERYCQTFAQRLHRLERVGTDAGLIRAAAAVAPMLRSADAVPTVVPQHSDFGPWNMLCDGERIVLLDFHNCSTGFAAYDAAFLLVALDLNARLRRVNLERLDEFRTLYLQTLPERVRCSGSDARSRTLGGRLFDAIAVMHGLYFGAALLSRGPTVASRLPWRAPPFRFVTRWIDTLIERLARCTT